MLRGQLPRHANRAVGSIGWVGVHNLCAVGMQNLLALERNIFRHAQGYGKLLRRSQHGVSDAGVAAGGVEQRLTSVEAPAAAALSDNIPSRTVFHRTTGVIPFGLTQQCY